MTLQHPPPQVPLPTANSLLPVVATGLIDQDRKRIEDALETGPKSPGWGEGFRQ